MKHLKPGAIVYCVMAKNATNEPHRLAAASMLASTLGIDFAPDQAWDEREQLFKMSGKIVKTRNITQSAKCNKNGLWTTVIASAVFVCSK